MLSCAFLGSLETPPQWLLAEDDFILTPAIPELTAILYLTNTALLGSWAGPCVHKSCWIAGKCPWTRQSLRVHGCDFIHGLNWIGENILNLYKKAELASKPPSKCPDFLQESQKATVWLSPGVRHCCSCSVFLLGPCLLFTECFGGW